MSKGDDLEITGPTLLVDAGYDPGYNPAAPGAVPRAAIKGVWALVDTGAYPCCIDNQLAARLSLPAVEQGTIGGISGVMTTNVYLAQVYLPALAWTIHGPFAGVDLVASGHRHQALLGRTFLRWRTMTYSGPTGDVSLSTESRS